MGEIINLKEFLIIIKKRFKIILLVTIASVLISSIYSYFFLTPIYQASTQILINPEKGGKSSNETEVNLPFFIKTSSIIIKSPVILDKVVDQLHLNMTGGQLEQELTVSSEVNSQVLNVTVQSSDASQVVKIVNQTAQVFQTEIKKFLNVENVSILAKATPTEIQSPNKSKPVQNIEIAFVIGLMLGIAIVILLESFDKTFINSTNQIENNIYSRVNNDGEAI